MILTALDVEYDAVRAQLSDLEEIHHPSGTLFEVGRPPVGRGSIALALTGQGNQAAAIITERAIATFAPEALLFVGIAGALHDDLEPGDVVVATKVYGYHGGKDEDSGFRARPQAWELSHRLDNLAHAVKRQQTWTTLIRSASPRQPQVHRRPVAAGEVVLNSRTTPLAEQLGRHYDDAAAIEMESAGVAKAGHFNDNLDVVTIRGISDRADGHKHAADRTGRQSIAAANAAAFALALAAKITSGPARPHPASAEQDPYLTSGQYAKDFSGTTADDEYGPMGILQNRACTAEIARRMGFRTPPDPPTWKEIVAQSEVLSSRKEKLLAEMQQVMGVEPDHAIILGHRHEIVHQRCMLWSAGQAVTPLRVLLSDELRILGPSHPQTLSTRHFLYWFQGQAHSATEAREDLRGLLADELRVSGPDHLQTLSVRHSLGWLEGMTGNTGKAVADLESLLRREERVLGPRHMLIQNTTYALKLFRQQPST